MKRTRLKTMLLTYVTLLLLVPTTVSSKTSATNEFRQIHDQLTDYFRARNQAIVDGNMTRLQAALNQVQDATIANRTISAVQRERAAMRSAGISVASAETAVELNAVQVQPNGQVLVTAYEYATLHLVTNGGPSKTSQRIIHRVRLAAKGTAWEVIADDQVDKESPQAPTPGAGPRRDPLPPTQTSDMTSPSLLPYANPAYNGEQAAKYAQEWALKRNSAYRAFDQDCTNFISQALRTEGWQYVNGWYLSTNAWWYNFFNQSRPWVNADNWYDFINGQKRGYVAAYVGDLQLGDILQIDFNKDGIIDHSTVVTSRDNSGIIYLSYHTTDTLDRPISAIVAEYPNANYYGWRITSVQ